MKVCWLSLIVVVIQWNFQHGETTLILSDMFLGFDEMEKFPTRCNEPSPMLKTVAESMPTKLKTGTTIVGICCSDGVVLGADTRTTGGPLVKNKNTLKINCIAPCIYCCGAGTAADCHQTKRKAYFEVASHRAAMEVIGESSYDPISFAVKAISNILKSSGKSGRQLESWLILGGYDDNGPALFQIDNKGVCLRSGYAALGSGSMNAIAVIEAIRKRTWGCRGVKPDDHEKDLYSEPKSSLIEDVCVEEAIDAVRQAVRAGIMNDLGSGSHVDLCVINKDGARYWREKMVSKWEREHESRTPADKVCDHSDSKSVEERPSLGTKILSRTSALSKTDCKPGSDNNMAEREAAQSKNERNLYMHLSDREIELV